LEATRTSTCYRNTLFGGQESGAFNLSKKESRRWRGVIIWIPKKKKKKYWKKTPPRSVRKRKMGGKIKEVLFPLSKKNKNDEEKNTIY